MDIDHANKQTVLPAMENKHLDVKFLAMGTQTNSEYIPKSLLIISK